MIQTAWLRKLVGMERLEALARALAEENKKPITPHLGNGTLLLAVLISLMPASSAYLTYLSSSLDVTTVAVGIAACLGMVVRTNRGITFLGVTNWSRSFYLTHTAFALGCIPTLLLMLFSPQALYNLGTYSHDQASVQQVAPQSIYFFILKVSLWAGFTEEFIFRGLIVSVARRWKGLDTQLQRDVFAVVLSALIFGAGHLHSWGPLMSLAVAGIGGGLAVAYIAIGERLLPVIIYHCLFDMLSLAFAIVGHKT